MNDCLKRMLRHQSILLSDECVERLVVFLQELLRWNQRINLTSIADPVVALEKHLVDSLLLMEKLPKAGALLDMGSGAGLPAIPLAIACPEWSVYSVDSVGKKISFQKHIKRLLGLKNLNPIQSRLEKVTLTVPVDVVTARALSRLDQLAAWAGPLLKPGGTLLVMKGPGGEEELESCRQGTIAYRLDRVDQYCLPESHASRQIISLSKV